MRCTCCPGLERCSGPRYIEYPCFLAVPEPRVRFHALQQKISLCLISFSNISLEEVYDGHSLLESYLNYIRRYLENINLLYLACVLCVPEYSRVNHMGDVLQVHPPRDKCPERSPWGLHLKTNMPRAVVVSLGVQCVPRELPSGCTLGRYLGYGLRGRSSEGI